MYVTLFVCDLNTRATRKLLNVCDDFATNFDVVFNASKSKCLVFKQFISRNMSNEQLSSTNVCSWPHLRHVLNVNSDDVANVDAVRIALCGQINNVLCSVALID